MNKSPQPANPKTPRDGMLLSTRFQLEDNEAYTSDQKIKVKTMAVFLPHRNRKENPVKNV